MLGSHLTFFQWPGQTCSLLLEPTDLHAFSSHFFWGISLEHFNAAYGNLGTLTFRGELPQGHLKSYREGVRRWMSSRSSVAKSLLFSGFKVSWRCWSS